MITVHRTRAFVRIGQGVHSEVFRRPGSRFGLQVFKPDCPELTVEKLRREYAYLRAVYTSLPRLIPRQRLVQPRIDASLQESVLVKDYVPHDLDLALHKVDPLLLGPAVVDQIRQFLRITWGLLASTSSHPDARRDASMLPDIIDPDWANLVIDTRSGDLTLIDTNRLISTYKLARLHAAGKNLDVEHRKIHALVFRRMMYLESKYLGRTRTCLARDPLYTRYLNPAGFEALFAASAAVGEYI